MTLTKVKGNLGSAFCHFWALATFGAVYYLHIMQRQISKSRSRGVESFISRANSRLNIAEGDRLPPLLYRVYKNTFQRQIVEVSSLNSHAAYLILLDDDCAVVGWVGSLCSVEDRDTALQISNEILTRDYGQANPEPISVVSENGEIDELFEAVLEALATDFETFNSKHSISERRNELTNAVISVGVLVPDANCPDGFERIERAFAHPDSEGAVPRVDFVSVEKDTIAYVVIGQQYDLWLARGVSDILQQNAISYMEKMVERDLFEEVIGLEKSKLVQHLQVVYQGEERYAFRKPLKIFTEFEPSGKTIPRSPEQLEVIGNAADIRKARNSNGHSGLKKGNSKLSLSKQSSTHLSEFRLEVEGEEVPSALTTDNLRFAGAIDHRGFYVANDGIYRANNTATNFWKDVKPVQQRHLYGVNDPNNEDYVAPTKVRMAMHDVDKITDFQYDILEHENLEIKERKDLLMRAKHEPSLLLGWQVTDIISSFFLRIIANCLYLMLNSVYLCLLD